MNCPSTEHLPLGPLAVISHLFPPLSTISHTSQDGGFTPTNKINITNVDVCSFMAYWEVSLKSCKTGRPSGVGRHIAPRHTSAPPGRFQRIRRDIQGFSPRMKCSRVLLAR